MRLDLQPQLPPFTDHVRLVGLRYGGATLTVFYNNTNMVIELLANGPVPVAINCSSGITQILQIDETLTLRREGFSVMEQPGAR